MTNRASMRILGNSQTVLNLLSERQSVSVAEIAIAINVPRATVHRTVELLAEADLVTVHPDGRCALSTSVFALDRAARAAYPVAAAARPHLTNLRDLSGQTVFLSVPRPDGLLCIDEASGYEVDLMVLSPGTVLPWNAGAGPRAAAAWMPDPQSVLAEATLHRYTPKTLVTLSAVLEEAARTRSRGYARSDEDLTVGVAALGVALIDPHTSEVVATLSVAGLRGRILADERQLVRSLQAAADQTVRDLFSPS